VAGFAYGMAAGGKYEPAALGLAAASLTLETDESTAANLSVERIVERIETRAKLGKHW